MPVLGSYCHQNIQWSILLKPRIPYSALWAYISMKLIPQRLLITNLDNKSCYISSLFCANTKHCYVKLKRLSPGNVPERCHLTRISHIASTVQSNILLPLQLPWFSWKSNFHCAILCELTPLVFSSRKMLGGCSMGCLLTSDANPRLCSV